MDASGFCLCRSASSSTVGVSKEHTGAIVGSTSGQGANEVVVTVQGDGVVTYNSRTQARTQSWPLGSGNVRFLLPTACEQRSGRFYAVVQATKGASSDNFLLSWARSENESGEGIAGTSSSLWGAAKKGPLPQREMHSLHPFSRTIGGPSQSVKEVTGGSCEDKNDEMMAAGGSCVAMVFLDGTIAVYGSDAELLCNSGSLPIVTGRMVEAVASMHTSSGRGKLDSQRAGAEVLWLAVITTETTISSNGESGADPAVRGDGGVRKRATRSVLRLFAVRKCANTTREVLAIDLLYSNVLEPPSSSNHDDSGRSSTILAAAFNGADTLSVLWSNGTLDVFRGFSKADSSKTLIPKSFSRKLEAFDIDQPALSPTQGKAFSSKSSKKRRAASVVHDAQLQGNSVGMTMAAVPRTPYIIFVGRPKQIMNPGSGSQSGALSTPLKDDERTRSHGLLLVLLDTLYGCVHAKAVVREADEGENTETLSAACGWGGVMGTAPGESMKITWVGCEDGFLAVSSNQLVMVVEVDLPPFSLAMVVGAFADIPTSGADTFKGASTCFANSDRVNIASDASSTRLAGRWEGLGTGVGRVTREVLGEKGVEEIVKPKLKAMPTPVWREEGDGKSAQRDAGGSIKIEKENTRPKRCSGEGGAGSVVLTQRMSAAPWDLEKVSSTDEEERNIIGAVQDESVTASMDVLMRRVCGYLNGGADLQEAADLDNAPVAEGLLLEGREASDARLTLREDLEFDSNGNWDAEVGDGCDADSRRNWKKALSRGRRRLVDVSPGLAEALVSRSIKSKFWPLLGVLIESGLANGPSVSPAVLAILIESKQPILMSKLVLHTSSLPPASLALFIKMCLSSGSAESRGWKSLAKAHREAARSFFLKSNSTKAGNDSRDAEQEPENAVMNAAKRHRVLLARAAAAVMAVDSFSYREQCLHSAIACDRDRTILMGALSRLDAMEVVGLMRYLDKWANFYARTHVQYICPKSIPGLSWPSMLQVLNWYALLLDCNFTRIPMLKDCHEMLASSKEVVTKHMISTRKVSSLSGALSHMRNKCYLPMKRALQGRVSAADYSIEFLQLE